MRRDNLQTRYMSKNILSRFTLVGAFVAALFLSGCGDDSCEQQRLNIESGKIINEEC